MQQKPMVWTALLGLGVLVATCPPLRAQDSGATDSGARNSGAKALLVPVHLLMQAINQGAAKCPSGVFTEDAVVIDDFSPYRWSGHNAGCDWYLALAGTDAASRAAFTALHASLTVGAPQFSRVSGDAAYFVLPGVFVFNVDAKTRHRQTASWLITERRTTGGWLVAGHTWAIMSETPVK